MLKRFLVLLFLLESLNVSHAQKNMSENSFRPKLVVGIVVDQMRWDYLYRFRDAYSPKGGFARLLQSGYSFDNTYVPYLPTVTAAGHSCIYTGSVPAINGIVANDWIDENSGAKIYCTDDTTVHSIGTSSEAVGQMSPRNLLSTTLGDALHYATNFKSKVISLAFKDRASILPGGHTSNGSYWYDPSTGHFITSSYYRNQLPTWLQTFNSKNLVDTFYHKNWTLYKAESVYKSLGLIDDAVYERPNIDSNQRTFPYNLQSFIGKDYSKIVRTPFANTITEKLAEAAIDGENLGMGEGTDMLSISFSTPDYIGHGEGPNSWEQIDDYIRLDQDLANFFNYLDHKIGKGNYLLFLTADHGGASAPGYNEMHHLPGDGFSAKAVQKDMNTQLKAKYGFPDIIRWVANNQVYLNEKLLAQAENVNRQELNKWIIRYLEAQPAILRAFSFEQSNSILLPLNLREKINNSYLPSRCGQIEFVLKPGFLDNLDGKEASSHGAGYSYDTHIPLIFYGWNVKKGSSSKQHFMTDIANTVSAMLHMEAPSGAVGEVLEEIK